MFSVSAILDLCCMIGYPATKKHYYKKDESWLCEREDIMGISFNIDNETYVIDTISKDILDTHNISNTLLTNDVSYYLQNKNECKFIPLFVHVSYNKNRFRNKMIDEIDDQLYMHLNNYATFFSNIKNITKTCTMHPLPTYFKNKFNVPNIFTFSNYSIINNSEVYYDSNDTLNIVPCFPNIIINDNIYVNTPSYVSNILFSLHDTESWKDINDIYSDIYYNNTNTPALNCIKNSVEQLFSKEDIFKNIETYNDMILYLRSK